MGEKKQMNEDEFLDLSENARFGEEFQRLDPMLKKIAGTAGYFSFHILGEKLKAHSIYRKEGTIKGETGIHSQFRAIDFKLLSKPELTMCLIRAINQLFVYDSRVIDTPEIFKAEELQKRQGMFVAHPNPFHGSGAHIHLQSHPNTVFMTKHLTVDLLALYGKESANFASVKA